MGLLEVLIILTLEGLLIGALARLALPGKDPLSLPATIAVGLSGAFVGGLLLYALSDGSEMPTFFSGFLVAVGIMYVIRKRRGGGLLSPGAHAERRPGPYER